MMWKSVLDSGVYDCLPRLASGKCRVRLEALPVLTVDPKRVEARGIMTECIFSHWFALLALDSDEGGGVRAWNKQ